MQASFDEEFYDVKVGMNVTREQAEILYDEVEGLLAIAFENIYSRKNGVPIDRIATPKALTGYLVEKLENSDVVVKEVSSIVNPMNFTTCIHVYVVVPNFWAIKYGTEVSGLDETLEFLKNPTVEEKVTSSTQMKQLINGENVSPIIGMLAYDQIDHKMKLWDGVQWRVAA